MNAIAIIGLLASIVILVIGAYRGLGALPLTLLASLVVILSNGINLWEGYATYYMQGYTGAYLSYFLLFSTSSLYAELMNISGCATSIGYKFIDWFGKNKVLLVCTLMISALTYGGVSLFVVVYAVAPIMFLLFREANLPRHLTMACLIAGSASWTMTALPGTPALTNVIPTQFLGTTLTADPIMGIICGLALIILCLVYMNYEENKARKNGEHWTEPEFALIEEYKVKDRNSLPAAWKSFFPMIALLLIIIIGSRFVNNSTMLATFAMLVGAILTFILNIDRFKDKNMKEIVTRGLGGGISGIGGLAGVVAFGTVVQNTEAYERIVDWVINLNLNPYVQGIVATAIVAGVTGSSSGGLRIMYSSLAENFLSYNINLERLHRLTSLAAGSLDTLPHSPGLFLMFPALGLTHKDAYKHVFVCTVLIPLIVTVVATFITVIMS